MVLCVFLACILNLSCGQLQHTAVINAGVIYMKMIPWLRRLSFLQLFDRKKSNHFV